MPTTLQAFVPQILIPHVPPLRPPPSQPATAPYAPLASPPRHHVPYWIIHSPTLPVLMMEKLRTYLTTAAGCNSPPSAELQLRVTSLPRHLLNTTARELSREGTTSQLWDIILFPIIRLAVEEVDQNLTPPTTIVNRTLYSQTPDALISPTSDTSPRLHREDKSWIVFNQFAPDILRLAGHNEGGRLGSPLELRSNEEGARSIIMKIGVSMIGRTDSLVPYGILFGGHSFMLFALFRNADTVGEVRYGLVCSDIIDCTNTATPLIPLIVYTLLGNTGPVQLYQPPFGVPPVSPVPAPVIQDSKPVTRTSCTSIMPQRGKVIFHTSTANGAVSRSFVLYREPSSQAVEDPFASDTPLTQFEEIELSLSECIGHGASGQVFIGSTDNEKYAVKIAPWENERQLLQREAGIYEILSDLQGRCIPKIYGYFGSEHLNALIMDFMGRSVENITDLSIDRRHQLLEELCVIHQYGIAHGDLQASNVVVDEGTAHFIDFSHGYEHECGGRTTCFELIEARRFLIL